MSDIILISKVGLYETIKCAICKNPNQTERGCDGACQYDKELHEKIVEAVTGLAEQRPHGKWEFVGNNLFKCTHCGYLADADYLRKWKRYTYDEEFPTACLKCGADMSANDRQVTGKLNSEIEKSKSEICPCIECCALDNSEPCRKGCSDYQKWKEGEAE